MNTDDTANVSATRTLRSNAEASSAGRLLSTARGRWIIPASLVGVMFGLAACGASTATGTPRRQPPPPRDRTHGLDRLQGSIRDGLERVHVGLQRVDSNGPGGDLRQHHQLHRHPSTAKPFNGPSKRADRRDTAGRFRSDC